MVRLYAVVLLLSALGGPALSDGIWPDMTCNRPQVLDLLHDVLHRAGKPETIERDSVGQVSTADPDRVRCIARVHSRIYDTNRLGYVPADRVELVAYTLELRRNGMFLRLE